MPENDPGQPSSPPAQVAPPFYGWRYVKRTLPDGSEDLEEIPLTLEDVLHPQEDDVIPENTLHEVERGKIAWWFRSRQARLDRSVILSDCLVDWGVEGIKNHSPDVSVFDQLNRPLPLKLGTFPVEDYGARCLLAVELVSPDTRNNDVTHKLREYQQVGVPFYLIVDQKREDGPRELLLYRNTATGYELVPLDGQGRIPLPALGLLLGLEDNQVVCYDADTGERQGDYTEVRHRLDENQQALAKADQALDDARQQMEREILEHRETRSLARAEAAARAAAEEQARAEAAARAVAERRIQELLAELQRHRGPAAP